LAFQARGFSCCHMESFHSPDHGLGMHMQDGQSCQSQPIQEKSQKLSSILAEKIRSS